MFAKENAVPRLGFSPIVVIIALLGGPVIYLWLGHRDDQTIVEQLRKADPDIEFLWVDPDPISSILVSRQGWGYIVPFDVPWIKRAAWVDVSGDHLTDSQVTLMRQLTYLRGVSIFGGKLTEGQLRKLSRLPRLERLDFQQVDLTGARLSALSGMTKLQVLTLSFTGVTAEKLGELSAVPSLRYLAFADYVGDEAVPALCKLKHLEYLEIYDTDISEAGYRQLRRKLPRTIIR